MLTMPNLEEISTGKEKRRLMFSAIEDTFELEKKMQKLIKYETELKLMHEITAKFRENLMRIFTNYGYHQEL